MYGRSDNEAMTMFDPQPEPDVDVSLASVVGASIEIFKEWEMIEAALINGDIPQAEQYEAVAYQEGLLKALSLLNSRTGVTLESMPDNAKRRLNPSAGEGFSTRHPRGRTPENTTPGECPLCGAEMAFEMGSEDPICLRCD